MKCSVSKSPSSLTPQLASQKKKKNRPVSRKIDHEFNSSSDEDESDITTKSWTCFDSLRMMYTTLNSDTDVPNAVEPLITRIVFTQVDSFLVFAWYAPFTQPTTQWKTKIAPRATCHSLLHFWLIAYVANSTPTQINITP